MSFINALRGLCVYMLLIIVIVGAMILLTQCQPVQSEERLAVSLTEDVTLTLSSPQVDLYSESNYAYLRIVTFHEDGSATIEVGQKDRIQGAQWITMETTLLSHAWYDLFVGDQNLKVFYFPQEEKKELQVNFDTRVWSLR